MSRFSLLASLGLALTVNYAVINDDVERAGREIQAIALGSRCRMALNEERIREILKTFGG